MIPLYRVHMPNNMSQVLEPVLSSGFITEGPKAKEFERAFQSYIGNPNIALMNSGTSAITVALRLAGVGPGTEVISSAMTCFSYLAPVLLEDGSTLPIGKIVNQKIPCKVLSFNTKKQKMEIKTVTNWIKQDSEGVQWYKIYTKNARASRGPCGKAGVFVTGDHKILTENGYVRVDNLKTSEEVVVNQQKLNSKQKEFINGTLLGDASISFSGKGWGRFNVTHTVSQKEWVGLKELALKGFYLNKSERTEREGHQAAIRLETKKNVEWRNLRLKWYPKGKKIVPKDINLTPLTLATWYMDDGSLTAAKGAYLCTEGFDSPSFWVLFYKLVDLGFKPHVVRRGAGYVITIGNGVDGEGSADRFFNTIGPYVPETMRYKLPGNAPKYNPSLWDLGTSLVATDKLVVTKVDRPPAWHKPSSVYCLEVEDNHNFITAGMVVSNCLATNEPVLSLGGKVVWCDVDPLTGNIDADKIEDLITEKTKAVLFVDWGGTPAEIDKINSVAKKYGLKTIEDAAQALGSRYKDRVTGTSCDFSCFSFQAIKHLTTVDGGALACKTKEDYDRAVLLRWFGLSRQHTTSPVCWEGDVTEYGYKMHMNDVNATIGLEQLKHIDGVVEKHKANGRVLLDSLNGENGITACSMADYIDSSFWFFTILLEGPEHRVHINNTLTLSGIGSNVTHTRNDKYSLFNGSESEMPGLDSFSSRMLNIPCGWWCSLSDMEYIVSVLKGA